MNKKLLLTTLICTSINFFSQAQVGVGTTTPNGALDVTSTTNGFVPPRVALTATNVGAPIVNPNGGGNPIAGTVVYNTATAGTSPNNVAPGLYYWNGTRWVAFAGSPGGLDWSLTGNTGTTPGTYAAPGANYLGTSDNTPLHFSTNGQPRMRITTNGNVGIGQSSLGSVRLNIEAIPTTDSAINAVGTGSNNGSIIPTASFTNTATDYATAVLAYSDKIPSATNPNFGLRAASGSSSFIGPATKSNVAISANATDLAIYGIIEGTSSTTRKAAEFRANDSGIATDSDTNDPFAYLAGYANSVNVDGTNTRNVKYGGYFYGGSANAYSYVGARLSTNITGNSNFKIIGPGTVSTIVSSNNENESKKIMFAPEAPEVLFEDYGVGQLKNGEIKIDIDPIFSKNIFVDEKHPLKVFIQLEGDCNGVFVTNKTKNSFTVVELNNGKSNVKFSWHIVGNRADEIELNGEKTIYQDLRFPNAPKSIEPSKIETKKNSISKTL